jgi:hypothetical protein
MTGETPALIVAALILALIGLQRAIDDRRN